MTNSEHSKIKVLPENLTNQIAAGEVVDRPDSVVKELVENAIDAGADDIQVIVRDGGKALIQVIDNGSGMSRADLLMAFQRHATSKIFEYEDLNNIRTLGFRGEALASIASVARVEARSALAGEASGNLVRVEAGVTSELEACAASQGTTITVKNLFFNTPARRRFLKSTNTEYRRILNVLNRFFLAFPEISFTLVNEDEVVLELAKAAQEERIAAVLGPRVQRNLLAVENTGPIRISGYVGNQDAMRRSRGDQYLFFNRRYFSHKNLHYAVISAYGDVLPRGSYPVYILFIEMSPGEVDVNVHPTKLEIKFANESLVFTSVRGAVKRALTSQEVVPELTPRSTFAPPAHDLDSPEQPPKPFFFPSGGAGSAERDPSLFVPHHAFERGDVPEARQGQQPERPVFEPTNVWQVHNKYIISQIKNGLIVIDQHVAHERVLYEQAMRNFERRKPSSQQLLFPQVVELSAEDYNLLLEILPFLEQIGFVIKSFSKNTVVVEGVPSGIKISDDEKILLQILDEYKRGKRDSAEIRENVAKSYACHTAIRAGEPLTLEAMNALIDQLFSTNEPYFCPHGRPVLIHIPLDELDRRFRRH